MKEFASAPYNNAMPDDKAGTKRKSYWFILPWEPHHPGGVNQVVVNLFREFVSYGMEPKIWVDRWQDKEFRFDSRDNLKLAFRRLREPCADGVAKVIKYWLALPLELIRLAIFLKREKVEVLNPHYPSASVLTLVILRKLGLFHGRLLLSFHGSDFDQIEKTSDYRRLIWSLILGHADGIIACSQAMSKRITLAFPEVRLRLRTIHNGVDLSRLEEETGKEIVLPGALNNVEYILNIGTFDQIKGQDLLIRAFDRLADGYPSLRLVLVGRDGPALKALRTQVTSLGLEKRVSFFIDMPHRNITNFLKAARVFVLSSRMESFGIVVLEAGALGVPVVASRVGGVVEILSAPEFATLVPPEDVPALAEAIRAVLEDPEQSKKKADKLRQHVLRNFTWSRAAEDYIEIGERA